MIITVIAFFSLTGVVGLCMLLFSFKESSRRPLKILANIFVAVTGLLLLFEFAFDTEKRHTLSAILFFLAAAGGVFMLLRDLAGRYTPGWMTVLHAAVALGGFMIFLLGAFVQ